LIPVGGQAVIEGVMMKAPKSLAVVVRRPNGEMVTKEDILHPWSDRFPFLKWPGLRGTLILMETMIQGIQALNFSANQAMTEEEGSKEIGWATLLGTLSLAILLGMGLFVALPHWIRSRFFFFSSPGWNCQSFFLYCLYLDYFPL
jgi:uncharacterized protein YqhQ